MTFPADLTKRLDKAAKLIQSSRSAVVFTGAGISVPSGIPDFRSASTGLWNQFDPMAVASLSAFRYRTAAFFDWLEPLVSKILQSQPNVAHISLAKLELAGYLKTTITQNIDGYHQKAGSKDVIELHGSLEELVCLTCCQRYLMANYVESWLEKHILPECPACKTLLKPDIVLYEELLPTNAWQRAEFTCDNADLILVVGTSLEVMPASGLPYRCVQNQAKLIILNLSSTPLDAMADVLLPMDVASAFPEICNRILD
ncbi:MAG: NAD-dependent deacylase [Leptolinea sp.]